MEADAFNDIKRLVWAFLDAPRIWQFLADSGWTNCSQLAQDTLNEAEKDGLDKVEVSTDAWTHSYSVARMEQTNNDTGKVRELRRISPWASVLMLPRWQYSTRFGWTDCDLDMQSLLAEMLAEAEARKESIVRRSLRGSEYEFDFVTLAQTNLATQRVRALRYGPPSG